MLEEPPGAREGADSPHARIRQAPRTIALLIILLLLVVLLQFGLNGWKIDPPEPGCHEYAPQDRPPRCLS